MKQTIDIIVEGGLVQDVIGVPAGIKVRVIDYDVEGTDDDRLSISPYDSEETCVISEFATR